jgi:hypothetical protein
MATPLLVRRAFALLIVAGMLAMGCGGDDASPEPSGFHTSTSPSSRPTTTTPAPDDTAAIEPEVLRFEAPAEVRCASSEASVRVTYTTRDVTTVAFAVDGASAGGTPAPSSGEHDVAVPCNGRVHTILLVAVGPSGQAVATRAVRTQPG